jgi:hypothetical protein
LCLGDIITEALQRRVVILRCTNVVDLVVRSFMYIASEGWPAFSSVSMWMGRAYVLADESSVEFCRSVLQLGLPRYLEAKTRAHSSFFQLVRRAMLLAFPWRAWLSIRSLSSDRCLGYPMSRQSECLRLWLWLALRPNMQTPGDYCLVQMAKVSCDTSETA